MSRTDLTDDVLADRLTRAFEAKASDVEASDKPFDPVRRDDDHLPPSRRDRSWRRPLTAVAAAVVVVALGAGAVVVRAVGDDAEEGPGSGPESPDAATGGPEATPVTPPDGVLAPSTVPDDLTLYSVDWGEVPVDAGIPSTSQQLFTRDDGAGVVIQLQPGEGLSGGEPVTVRGLAGTTTPAKEFADTDTSLFWSEGGVSVTATYTAMSQADAVAFLDTLTWRSDDHMQGFDPLPSAELTLRTESLAGQEAGTTTPVLTGRFGFAADAATVVSHAGRQVEVRTSTGSVSGTSSTNLQQAMHGDTRPDGGVEAFDPDFGTLTVTWPDGRSLWVDAYGSPVTRDELEEIAAGVAPVDGATLADLAGEASAAVLDGSEVVAAADLPSATVTVRRLADAELVCVTPTGGDEVCPGALDGGTPSPGDTMVSSSLLNDGTWWVAAVASSPVSVEEMPEMPTGLPGWGELTPGMRAVVEFEATIGRSTTNGAPGVVAPGAPVPAETAELPDGRTVVLARPDPGLTSVLLVPAEGYGREAVRPGG